MFDAITIEQWRAIYYNEAEDKQGVERKIDWILVLLLMEEILHQFER